MRATGDPDPRRATRYRLERLLGTGGSAAVWQAAVAVKRPAPDAPEIERQRLRREAAVLSRLRHPNVVRLVELIDDGDELALVLEHAPGGSLAGLLAARGRLAPGEIVAVVAPIADALAAAHALGIVHGDISPANILLGGPAGPLLADFGCGAPLRATEGFAAPEVVAGANPGPAADVYALAAVCAAACARPTDALAGVLDMARSELASRRPTAVALSAAMRAAVPPAEIVLPALLASTPLANRAAEPVTRPFGPQPPRPAASPPSPAKGGLAPAVVALVATAVVTAAAFAAAHRAGAACPTPSGRRAPAGAQLVLGDPDGDGCDSFAIYAGGVLAVNIDPHEPSPRRYAIGRDGDVLLLGDWDCDRADTPGIYRPSTGEIIYFDGWGEAGASSSPAAYSRAPVAGRASVRPGRTGCEDIAVTPAL